MTDVHHLIELRRPRRLYTSEEIQTHVPRGVDVSFWRGEYLLAGVQIDGIDADSVTPTAVTHNPACAERAGRRIHLLDVRLRDQA